jgi:hypothetical protein
MSTDVSELHAAAIIIALMMEAARYLWNVGWHSIKNTAVHPTRFWASSMRLDELYHEEVYWIEFNNRKYILVLEDVPCY